MTDKELTPEAVEAHIERIDPHGYAQPKSLNDDTKTLLRALSAERDKLQKGWSLAVDQCDKEYARADAAEAKLKEAVKRMEEVAHMGYDMPSTFAGTEGEWYSRRANLMQGIARAFLATLDQST